MQGSKLVSYSSAESYLRLMMYHVEVQDYKYL